MKKVVNLTEILEKCDKYSSISEAQKTDVIAAMKEACKQTLELAAERAAILIEDSSPDFYYTTDKYNNEDEIVTVSKKSILDTFNWIEI